MRLKIPASAPFPVDRAASAGRPDTRSEQCCLFAEHFAAQRLAWRVNSRQRLHEVRLRGLVSSSFSGRS
ncbi:MAG: hypothetical protein AVDCRST_MAG68-2557 [uncultured Gemmatimonadetes bacterium]|uniref:Uncharacterized protein n=1 Tax=uncultured Gemmatimonadota bacterium TaxID=203437 RepID=A0A6J4LFP3_9BACT|nr:MAG: hypothetical protein AVDCRST_MAG68-2557 [uncultured Gemmatimonadota bacterium]